MHIHDCATIVIERHDLSVSLEMACGVRQGCCLSPLLWLAFTILLYDDLSAVCPSEAIACFADDLHVGWSVNTTREFRNASLQIGQLFQIMENHGMLIAMDKTAALLAMKGPAAPEFTCRVGKDRFLVLRLASRELRIPLKQNHRYPGIQIGYGKFERATVLERLRLSWVAFHRLHPFLKHQSIPV